MQTKSYFLVALAVTAIFGYAGYILGRTLTPLTFASPEWRMASYTRQVPTPTPQEESISYNYDLNQDSQLDYNDYKLLLSLIGTNDLRGDLNKSGVVDVLDYQLLAMNFVE